MHSVLAPAVRGAMAHGFRSAISREAFGDRCVAHVKAKRTIYEPAGEGVLKLHQRRLTRETIDRLYELYQHGKIDLPGEGPAVVLS